MSTTEQPGTPFSYRCAILADMFTTNHKDFEELKLRNDLSFAFAFGVQRGLVDIKSEKAIEIIDGGFDEVLDFFGVEDNGYEDFQELLEETEWYDNYLLEEHDDDDL
jgi:hypothetical protein